MRHAQQDSFPQYPSTFAADRDVAQSDFAEFMLYVNAGRTAERSPAARALTEVLFTEDRSRDSRLGSLLAGSLRIATPEMVAGFIDAVGEYEGRDLVRDKPSVKRDDSELIVGCAGSGKKGRKTINITTPAMVVAAAAGAKVLKAGSRAASSITGSTDILEAVDFTIPQSQEASTELLHETNFGFYPIERTIPRFDAVYGNRFFTPHALSFVLPAVLIPVQTDTILYGYAGPEVSLSARAFHALGYSSVLVCNNTVDGLHYIDEMATEGATTLAGVQGGEVGMPTTIYGRDHMRIEHQLPPSIDSRSNCDDQKQIFTDILEGNVPDSRAENTICINAATMLYLGKICLDPRDAFVMAKETIRSGASYQKMKEIVAASHDIR